MPHGETDIAIARGEGEAGLSRSAIYALMTAGTFPRPLRIGARAVTRILCGGLRKSGQDFLARRFTPS